MGLPFLWLCVRAQAFNAGVKPLLIRSVNFGSPCGCPYAIPMDKLAPYKHT